MKHEIWRFFVKEMGSFCFAQPLMTAISRCLRRRLSRTPRGTWFVPVVLSNLLLLVSLSFNPHRSPSGFLTLRKSWLRTGMNMLYPEEKLSGNGTARICMRRTLIMVSMSLWSKLKLVTVRTIVRPSWWQFYGRWWEGCKFFGSFSRNSQGSKIKMLCCIGIKRNSGLKFLIIFKAI